MRDLTLDDKLRFEAGLAYACHHAFERAREDKAPVAFEIHFIERVFAGRVHPDGLIEHVPQED